MTALKNNTAFFSPFILLLATWFLSNFLLATLPAEGSWGRIPAAFTLTFILPGLAWLPPLHWMHTDEALERLCLILGVSSLLSALALFIALMSVTPFREPAVMVALNLTIGLGALAQFRWPPPASAPLIWPSRQTLLILLAIFAVALLTRATRLGYAEFHEDELENMRLIVRAYKGEAYAAFLDSKGPIHWLLPAALWYLNGWVNEGLARLPMLLTALLLIPLMYALGRRMSGGQDAVGLVAAAFVTVNGFFVAYARHVENQSLIVFWGALTMWWAYRYYQGQTLAHNPYRHFLFYMALALAIGLIAHPDVLLYLPVFAYMVIKGEWHNPTSPRSPLIGAGLLFLLLTASFYIPYLTDPQIGLVYQYFASDRIGGSLFYNRLDNLFDQDQLYSTRYHAPILMGLLIWLLGRQCVTRRHAFSFIVLLSAAISTAIWPHLWLVQSINLAFLPHALLTLLVLWLPQTSFELKSLYLWLTAPLGALLFLAQDAADHVQIAYTAWALLAAFAFIDVVKLPSKYALGLRGGLLLIACLITPLIIYYQYLMFASPVTTYWQAKQITEDNPNSLYHWLYGGLPRPRKLFSNPRLGGWKAVGYLYEQGLLQNDFRSMNESFAVPIWYTFETPRSCYDDPENLWVQRDWAGWPDEEAQLLPQGYTLSRVILVDQQPKLHLYERYAPVAEPEIIDLEAYRQRFDYLATPARFIQGELIQQSSDFNFADKLRLYGYTIPTTSLTLSDTLRVTVFWQTLAPMTTRYRSFLHLVDAQGHLWAQQDDDPACRLLTTDMRPGQESSRQFRLKLDPTMPPGEYRLILGLYDPNTLTRLAITPSANDHVVLGQITLTGQ